MGERQLDPVIRVKGLYKIYRVGETKVYALNGVDFEVYRGQFIAIVGASGSGKSTLLNMLAGLEKPTKGQIEIGGRHIEKLSEKQLVALRREKVGFIFQSYNLLNTMNALENVAAAFPDGRFVEYHFPGLDPQMEGYDWCSLKVVFEAYNNQWYLVGLIHSQWTI